MENRLIKNFCFIEKERKNLTLSDPAKIRLNTENKANQRVMLKGPPFSTDSDLHVETSLINPRRLKKWLLFEIIYKAQSETLDLPEGTSLGVKVKTTGDDYWWNSSNSQWEVAGASDWSTEKEISDNIETFPIATVGNKKIGFKINLKTTDPDVTPEVFELKLLGLFEIEPFDDLVYDSIIRLLNTEFRARSVVRFASGASSISSVDLSSVLENQGYNIFDVVSVYNLTDDPERLVDLHDSYSPGAARQDGFTFDPGTETFSSSIPAGKWVEVEFEYVPEISVKVNQDYFEAPSYPHIVFTRITEVERRGFLMRDTNSAGRDHIRDKTALNAVQQFSPSQKSYRFDFLLYTGALDQFRLLGAVKNFFANHKTLRNYGLDNEHALEIIDEIDTVGNSQTNDTSDTNLAKGSFDVLGVLFYDKPSRDIPLVTQLNVNVEQE